MKSPLAGMRVLDLGQGVAGPYCSMLLADLGADVVKVEPPRGDWGRTMGTPVAQGMGSTFVSVNRGKRSLCLDMRNPQGLSLARKITRHSDILVESFRPGVLSRLGLGYETLSSENPEIIYCSISGFGPDGPAAHLPAGDSVMQAYGGFMSINGEADGQPIRAGNVISDMLAGMYGAQGILAAAIVRERGGGGDHVEVSLLDSLMAFQTPPLIEYLVSGKTQQRSGAAHPLLAPSGTFSTADGAIVLTVLDHQWRAFCVGFDVEELLSDPRFADNASRVAHRIALASALAPALAARSTTECLESLRAHDVLCAPINDYEALVADPQVVWNDLVGSLDHPTLGPLPALRGPVRGAGSAMSQRPAPRLGEHTCELLAEILACSRQEAEVLAAAGAVLMDTESAGGDKIR